MTDPTKDIDGLLGYLSIAADRYSCHTIPSDVAANYHAALVALVAERDGLKQERQMYWESCDALEKQTIDLKARVAELEAQPPADRDRELRERLDTTLAWMDQATGMLLQLPHTAYTRDELLKCMDRAETAAMRKGEANGE